MDYLLGEDWAKKRVDSDAEVIYVIGGLYGNPYGLREIQRMAKEESSKPLMIFNGDMHWFDVGYEDFMDIEDGAEGKKLLGNVEFELSAPLDKADCGCHYPPNVHSGTVARSNEIHTAMKKSLKGRSILEDIQLRPMTASLRALGVNIAITHGDEKSMAGWDCSREALQEDGRRDELRAWLERNDVDIFATTHTCAPAMTKIAHSIVSNNGASGMANVAKETWGLITRIAKKPHSDAVVSKQVKGIYVELVKVDFDIDAFLDHFDARWPEGSAANISYRSRIAAGTDLQPKVIDLDRL